MPVSCNKLGQSRAVQKVFLSQNIKGELTNEGPVKNPNPFGRTGCRADFHTGLHRQLFLLRVFHFGPAVQGQPISCSSLALLRACHMEKKRGNLRKPAEKSNSQQQPRVSIKTAVSMSSNGSELLVPFVLNRKQRDIDQYMYVCIYIYTVLFTPKATPTDTSIFSFQALKAVQPASPQDLLCVAGRSSLTSSKIQPSPPGEICQTL